jgi:hypothetical protein
MVMSRECLGLVSTLSIAPISPGSTIRLRPAVASGARPVSWGRDGAAVAEPAVTDPAAHTVRPAVSIAKTMERDERFKGSSLEGS